ncbi:MAG: hypothetical protein R2800_14160 [Flavipsychrobacter sp.]
MKQQIFKGFDYSAKELSAYAFSIDTFIISLKTDEIIQFVPDDAIAFRKWLDVHGIRDVNNGEVLLKHK